MMNPVRVSEKGAVKWRRVLERYRMHLPNDKKYSLDSFTPNEFNGMLNDCLIRKEYVLVRELIECSPEPNTSYYNRAIKALGNFNQFDEAHTLFSRLGSMTNNKGYDEASYIALLGAFMKCKRYKELGRFIDSLIIEKCYVKPGNILSNLLVEYCLKLKDYPKLKKVLIWIRGFDTKMSEKTLDSALEKYCKKDNMEVFNECIGFLIHNKIKFTIPFEPYFRNYVFSNDLITAVKEWKYMIEYCSVPNIDTIKSLMRSCFDGDKADAVSGIEKIVMPKYDLNMTKDLLHYMLKRYIQGGHLEFGEKLILRSVKKHKIEHDQETLRYIIQLKTIRKRVGMALDTLKDYANMGIMPDHDTLTLLLNLLLEKKKIHEAILLFNTMKDYQATPSIENVQSVLLYYVKERKIKKAKMFLDSCISHNIEISYSCLSILMKGYLDSKNLDKALELLNTYPDFGVKPTLDDCHKLLRVHIKTKNYEKCLEIIQNFHDNFQVYPTKDTLQIIKKSFEYVSRNKKGKNLCDLIRKKFEIKK